MPRAEMIQFRRGSMDQWNLVNPILADGEVGFASDSNLIRIGDGVTAWADLPSPSSPEAEAALAEINSGRLSEAQLSATFVRFVDHITGEPIDPAGTVVIKVNVTTGDIDDIVFEEV